METVNIEKIRSGQHGEAAGGGAAGQRSSQEIIRDRRVEKEEHWGAQRKSGLVPRLMMDQFSLSAI